MTDNLNFLKEKGVEVEYSLSILGDEQTYNDVLRDFYNGFVDQMNGIKSAFEQKNWKQYSILVHTLKSNCKTFGFMKLSNMALDHQTNSENMNINFVNLHITEMFTQANELYRLMDAYFKKIDNK